MIDLSVIIVNYNVSYFLEQCLHSVARASEGINVETIVVDNNSVDGSVAMVRQKFPEVRLIANQDNLGFSKANNQAIKESNGRYVLLLNPDTLVEEDTFTKTVSFMDEHRDAGGLGVKMIDGKGRFLPESKRGLPTPAVAFFKIFGLSWLFPKSKLFGRYHLGYLPKDQTHSIDILSGAFMLMRKSVLDKTGLLDESFFMYGEDIDLSYRIIQAGFKNYYYPEARIIHYKGESTKKSSINYVFVFYRAMVIFAKKHFSKTNANTFGFLINLAIYFRAGIAIVQRFIRKISLFVLDFLAIFGSLFLLKKAYESFTGIGYQSEMVLPAFGVYTFVWILSCLFNGAYDRPYSTFRILRGIAIGSLLILMVYALLPESLRFSRALILMGTGASMLYYFLTRGLINYFNPDEFQINQAQTGIVAEEDEFERIEKLLADSGIHVAKPLRISPRRGASDEEAHVDRLKDIVAIYGLQTIIFSGKDVASQQIIELMSSIGGKKLRFKIAPPESAYIIGSDSIERSGEVYLMDLNAINRVSNTRRKRLMDLVLGLFFLLTYPFIVWGIKDKIGFLRNILSVLSGKKSWVGYAIPAAEKQHLPKIKKGVLSPLDKLRYVKSPNETGKKLNSIYAREYGLRKDLAIMSAGFPNLGRRN